MTDNFDWPIATYNIELIRPAKEDWIKVPLTQQDKRVLSNLPAMLEAVEEDLTSLLPPGYSARIREWSSDE